MALPLAACSGDMPLAQDTKNTMDKMKISDKRILLMVSGLIIKKDKHLIKSVVTVLSLDWDSGAKNSIF